MKVKLKFYLLIIVICLIHSTTYATHIIGGDFSYKYLSANNYEINLNLYRDCYNGVPPFDNPAFVTIFNSSGNVITTLQLQLQTLTLVTLVNYSQNCVFTPTDVCVEQGTYKDTVNLPPIVGGYTIVYQRCCRSGTILNIVNPNTVGSTYWAHIPGHEVVLTNSSPRFNTPPLFYFCNNVSNSATYSAFDDDGDSLSYFLTNPFDGLDGCCPIISQIPNAPSGVCASPPAICPSVNTPPPYLSVVYSSGYNPTYPISSSPAISMNANNGFISLTPNLIGDFAIGIGIKEYRNHILIGTYYQDFHTKVVNCSPCTGINELANIEVNIYPNPLSNSIIIKCQYSNYYSHYTLTDLTGNIVLKDVMYNNAQSIDVKNISRGIYFLKIYFNNNLESVVKKVIIE